MQQTISHMICVSGVGIHSGESVNLELHPASVNSGITFQRGDKQNTTLVAADYKNISKTQSCTQLSNGDTVIDTVEHLISACWGCGIDNLRVVLDAPELPIMDGSALPFVQAIQGAVIVPQNAARKLLKVNDIIHVEDGDKFIEIRPYDGFKVDCAIQYDHPLFTKESQRCRFELGRDDYATLCAPARTYGFMRDYDYLLKNNLARGASLANVLVLGDDEVENKDGMRFADECVRHKLLDLLGDFFLCGMRLQAEIIAYKSGHALNAAAVRALMQHYSRD